MKLLIALLATLVLSAEPIQKESTYLLNMKKFVEGLGLSGKLSLTHLCIKEREVCGQEIGEEDLFSYLRSRGDFHDDHGNFRKFHPGSVDSLRHGVNPSAHFVKYEDGHVGIHVDWTAPRKGEWYQNFRHAVVDVIWPSFQRRVFFKTGITNQRKLMNQYSIWLNRVSARSLSARK